MASQHSRRACQINPSSPVITEAYAVKIAHDWNVPSSGTGYVTQYEVLSSFLSAFYLQDAGGVEQQEYWIPAFLEEVAVLSCIEM